MYAILSKLDNIESLLTSPARYRSSARKRSRTSHDHCLESLHDFSDEQLNDIKAEIERLLRARRCENTVVQFNTVDRYQITVSPEVVEKLKNYDVYRQSSSGQGLGNNIYIIRKDDDSRREILINNPNPFDEENFDDAFKYHFKMKNPYEEPSWVR